MAHYRNPFYSSLSPTTRPLTSHCNKCGLVSSQMAAVLFIQAIVSRRINIETCYSLQHNQIDSRLSETDRMGGYLIMAIEQTHIDNRLSESLNFI